MTLVSQACRGRARGQTFPTMLSNNLKKIAAYQQKIAALERQLAKVNSRLLALPAKFGFKSVDDLIAALRTAQASAGAGKAVAAGKPRRKRATITPEMKQQLKKLVEAGKTAPVIAKALGISIPSVYKTKKDLGLVGGK